MRKLIHFSGSIAILAILITSGCSNSPTSSNSIPKVPSNLVGLSLSPSSVKLSWIDNSNNETGFIIFRSQGNPDAYVAADTLEANQSFFTDTGLFDSTTYLYYVSAYNNGGVSGQTNVITITTSHAATAPSPPESPVPPNNTTGESLSVVLTWQASDPNGDWLLYDVYFGTDPAPPLVASDLSANRYDPGPLHANLNYYWQVAAHDSVGNITAGPIWNFSTIVIPNGPPGQPSNPTPIDGAINQPVSLTLSWQCQDPENDPLIYDVYFGDSLNAPIVVTGQSGTSYNPATLTNGVTYYWKIVAHDTSGNATMGPTWRFTTGLGNQPPAAPNNPSPADGATRQATNILLGWQSSDPEGDSLTYDVYLGTTSSPPVLAVGISQNNFNPGNLGDSTTYYWKIVAHDNHGHLTSGPVWSFSTLNIVNQPPNAPSNPSPSNGQTNVPISTQLTWQDSDPDGDALNYDVYFGSINPPPFIGNQTGRTYDPAGDLIGGTVYYWRIVAHDEHGAQTSGPLWSFTTVVVNLPPDVPSNPSPVNGQDSVALNTALGWQGSDPNGDPLTFDVYFGTVNPPPFIRNQSGITYDPPGNLQNSRVYYWMITARDNHGGVTAGPVWNFITIGADQPPSPPSNPSPPDGQDSVSINTTLSWQASDPEGEPLTYDIYFGTSSNPPRVASNRSQNSYSPGQLANNTTYYWKIVVYDNHDNQTTGPIWDFTTIPANRPPNPPTGPLPDNNQTNVPVTTILSWQDSDPEGDPLNYDVYFEASNPPTFIGNQTANSYDPAGDLANNTIYYWRIVGHDDHGNQSSGPTWSFVTLVGNLPPNVPSNPSPPNGSADQDINLTMTWQGSDPNNDPLTYDVYFGTAPNPPLVVSGQTPSSYAPGTLVNNTTYYWLIVAHDNQGAQISGPTWSFTSIRLNNPPNVPDNPFPAAGQDSVPVNATLTWQDTDPDGDPLNYDFYFGIVNPPPYQTNRDVPNYNPSGDLLHNVTYFWQVLARDSHGATTAGPIWSFRTIAINNPPFAPSNPRPPDRQDSMTLIVQLGWHGSDPENDPLTYDVYFGTTNPPPLIRNQADTTYITPDSLNGTTTYYWRIIAHDIAGNQTAGPVWRFTTLIPNRPPTIPSSPHPRDNQNNVNTNTNLSWQSSDPDDDPINFDLYLGTDNPPPFIQNQTGQSYNPPDNLHGNARYYWQIIVHDNQGHLTVGPLWTFRTD